MKIIVPQSSDMVMVKLFGESLDNITEVKRNEAQIYARRVQEAKELGIKAGIKREGKIDTGKQLTKNARLDCSHVIADLEDSGFEIDDIHIEHKGDVPILVAVMTRREDDAFHPLRGEFIAKLGTFTRVNVWLNPRPAGNTNVTVNCSEQVRTGSTVDKLRVEAEAPVDTTTT